MAEDERKIIECKECLTECYEDETIKGCCPCCALLIASQNGY